MRARRYRWFLVAVGCLLLSILVVWLVRNQGSAPASHAKIEHGISTDLEQGEPGVEGRALPEIQTPREALSLSDAPDPREPTRSLRLRVADETTGQGIPWLQVGTKVPGAEGGPEFTTLTDEYGECQLVLPAEPDRIGLRLFDVEAGFEARYHLDELVDEQGKSAVAKVRIGPTYVLDIDGTDKPGDLHVQLAVDVPHDARVERWLPLRRDPVTWVRFPATLRGTVGPAGLLPALKVCDDPGLRAGVATVPGTVGVYLGPTRVYLRRLSGVQGVVRNRDGAACDRARVGIAADFAGSHMPYGLGLRTQMFTGENGLYRFTALEPGAYTLTAETESSYPTTLVVELPPGTLIHQDIQLGSGEVGTLSGTIISRLGCSWSTNPIVSITPLDGSEPARAFEVNTAKGSDPHPSRMEGNILWNTCGWFEIKDVPARDYVLSIGTHGNAGRPRQYFEPASLVVRPPDDQIELTYLPSQSFGPCLFRVTNTEHSPVEPFDYVDFTEVADELDVHLSGIPIPRHCVSNRPVTSVMERAPLRWMVRAPGYQPMFGDQSAVDWASNKYPHHVDVQLAPGWGGLVLVYREDPDGVRRAFPGVEVVADGVSSGRTDGEGLFRLVTGAPVRCLEARQLGYVSHVWAQKPPFMPTCFPEKDQCVFLFVLRPQ